MITDIITSEWLKSESANFEFGKSRKISENLGQKKRGNDLRSKLWGTGILTALDLERTPEKYTPLAVEELLESKPEVKSKLETILARGY